MSNLRCTCNTYVEKYLLGLMHKNARNIPEYLTVAYMVWHPLTGASTRGQPGAN